MKALLKVDEECQHLRHLKDHLRAQNAEKLLKIQISSLDFLYFSNISYLPLKD